MDLNTDGTVLCGSLATKSANMEAIEATMYLEVQGANGFRKRFRCRVAFRHPHNPGFPGLGTECGGNCYAAAWRLEFDKRIKNKNNVIAKAEWRIED